MFGLFFFFFKQKTAYEIRPCDWSSDVCSSDLERGHVRALSAPALRRARGGLELDRRLARSPRPQVPRPRPPDAHPHAAQRVLLPAMPDLGGPRRVGHRPDGRAPGRRLLRLGVGLSAHRRLLRRRARAEGAPRAAARRGAPKSPGPERAAVLPARGLTPSHARGQEAKSSRFSRREFL